MLLWSMGSGLFRKPSQHHCVLPGYGERGYEHPLAAYHFAWPAIGHVAKQGDGFRYYPEGMAL
jgi:hypothetical protein